MDFPSELKYTEEHEWIRIEENNVAVIGITEFAQSELGDIVFVEVETVDEELEANAVFGTIEAVKTVSDLFLPVNGKVIEFNEKLEDEPELVNSDPYGDGWIIKMEIEDMEAVEALLDSDTYKNQVGQ
ncbi:glycine cleavage system protein GcvH [Jiulongibacter sp. NS-SX5]|uniref:glycine cleavage system protein GcvH n=1 Tax=Jiulongibacter sp. NS-SX5 TaxID=3463854 RepID=UPI004059A9F7